MSEGTQTGRTLRERRLRAERGALLARRGGARTVGRTHAYLVCACGPERYGLPLADVSGVLPMRACTPVPGAVPALLGLATLSGRIVGVLGLARALGRPVPDPEGGHLVTLRPGAVAALACALAVDRALGVVHVAADAIVPAGADSGAGPGTDLSAGAGLGGGIVLGYAPPGPEAAGADDFVILDLPPLLRRALP